jgi:hypothetical protein
MYRTFKRSKKQLRYAVAMGLFLTCHGLAFSTSAFLGLPNPYEMVDWRRHNNRFWVVVDPMSSRHGRTVLLYLTEPAYQRMSRIAISNDMDLEIIATPEDSPESIESMRLQWSKEHPENSGPDTVTVSSEPPKK